MTKLNALVVKLVDTKDLKADANKNKEITNGELLAYMDINVSQKALELGRQQNPSLAGDPDQVLMKY